MKKLGIVLGVAALTTLVGCKDADYKGRRTVGPQNDVKTIAPAPAEKTVAPAVQKKCVCPPGTRHTAPCTCGAPGCVCIVVEKTPPPPPVVKPAEPEVTVYVVQSGDYLAKISKRYNVTIAAIKKLNPSIKGDVIRVGQKLKLPGTFVVGAQPAPAVKARPPKAAKKPAAAYTGATKAYVVRSGDTLGAIAYGNGITIRQLKKLNGLSSDVVRVGQKLKIPADAPARKKPVAQTPAVKALPAPEAKQPAEQAAPAPAEKPAEAPAATEETPVAAPAQEPAAAEPAPSAEAKPAADAVQTTTYVVQEGDDMTSVSISWGVSAAAIRELNNLGDNDQLKPGQVIKLPADAQQ